jgi:hypothetical protein
MSFEKTEDFIRNPHYERRVVALYDILGWRAQIAHAGYDATKIGELRRMILRVGRMLSVQRESAVPDLRFSTFSDNVVISYPSGSSYVARLLGTLGSFQFGSATAGFMVRGGVTIGDIVHDEYAVFGPALNRAYELESNVAQVPRIVVDEAVVGLLNNPSLFTSSEDGVVFIDPFTKRFLSLIQQLEQPLSDDFWTKVGIPNPGGHSLRAAPQDALLRAALEQIKKQLRGPLEDKEWRKLAWLFDRIARQLGVPLASSYPRVHP